MKIDKMIIANGLTYCTLVSANPSDPTITRGSVNFEQSDAKTLTITTSDKAHIFWGNFSIEEDEMTEIVQPTSDSMVVIQIESDQQSFVLGKLKANGQVFLINPNGTYIGSNGHVEANAFFASTIPTCACTLLDGQEDIFFQGENASASIVNNGRIKAETNDVFLIGYQIQNKGAIDALMGTVGLAAGREVIWKRQGKQKIAILSSFMKEENEETGIDNSGMINACSTELNADGNIYSVAIRHAGLINAIGIQQQRGQIHLLANNGHQGIFGSLFAENGDGTGGVIHVFGESIALFENSTIDASGEKGGGQVYIGNGNSLERLTTKAIFIDNEVMISADAIDDGNGGTVIVSADGQTVFFGTISVCGGDNSGDGGRVEIYGERELDFNGEVDFAAPRGAMGTLQLHSLR